MANKGEWQRGDVVVTKIVFRGKVIKPDEPQKAKDREKKSSKS